MNDHAAELQELVARARDVDHPKGWLTCWSDEVCQAVLEAAAHLESLEQDLANYAPAVYRSLSGKGMIYAIYGSSSISYADALEAKIAQLTTERDRLQRIVDLGNKIEPD